MEDTANGAFLSKPGLHSTTFSNGYVAAVNERIVSAGVSGAAGELASMRAELQWLQFMMR